jgi:hypothetical protein
MTVFHIEQGIIAPRSELAGNGDEQVMQNQARRSDRYRSRSDESKLVNLSLLKTAERNNNKKD